MTVKEYLKQAFILNKIIKAKQSRIQDLRETQSSVRTPNLGVRVQTSRKADPIGDITAVIIDLINECQKDIARLLDLQREIESLINRVERQDYRLILYERYVNLKRWEDIAWDNNYSLRMVHKLHGFGLNLLKECIEVHPLDVV